MSVDPAAEATRTWLHQLASHPSAEEDAARFAEAADQRNISYSGRRVCNVFRPRFLSQRRREELRAESHLVMAALRKAELAVLADPDRWAPHLGRFSEIERELMELPRRLDRGDVSVRLDAVELGDGFRFFELNGAVPGGIEFTAELTELFSQTATFHHLAGIFTLHAPNLRGMTVGSLLAAWRKWGGSGTPTVAIVDWLDDAPLIEEFRLVQRWLHEVGVPAFLADPRELEFRDGRLQHSEGAVDLVYRRLITAEIVQRPAECAALLAAIRAQAACVVDPVPQSTLDRKALFAFVTDPTLDPGLTPQERAACDRSIPWTRLLTDTRTTDRAGAQVDLLDHVRDNRQGLILKPNHDFGGHGIHLGWEMTDSQWADAIETALAGEWVAQEAEPHTFDEPYPLLESPREAVGFHGSTDPYLWAGDIGGVLTRLTHDGSANVTAGGSAVPTFIVSG